MYCRSDVVVVTVSKLLVNQPKTSSWRASRVHSVMLLLNLMQPFQHYVAYEEEEDVTNVTLQQTNVVV